MTTKMISCLFFLSLFLCFENSFAQTDEESSSSAQDLAQQLSNPVASLISVPFQNNLDFNIGPNEGFRYNLNIQPVIPLSISENWNLISRTIVPFISQKDVFIEGNSETGLGDIAQSIFFSPKAATESGIVWGVGPILLLPTATDDRLGANVWGAGPSAVVLKLSGPFTYGALVNHTWSYAGDGNDLSATFFQPFLTYAKPDGSSYTINTENTQSWKNDIFAGAVGVFYAKVTKFGSQLVQLGGGPRVFYGNNPFNPDFAIRLNLVLLYPK